MPEAILFDLDDTILAEDAVYERCWRQVCDTFASCIAALGVNAADMLVSLRDAHHWYLSNPDRSREFGLNLGLIRREIVALAFDKLGVTGDSALTLDMGDAYHTLKSAKSTTSELVPGALDTIHYFRRHGVKLGLITNGDAQGQRAKIDRFNLDALFDSVVVEGEFGVGKPDARVFQHSLAVPESPSVPDLDGGRQPARRHRWSPGPRHLRSVGRLSGKRPTAGQRHSPRPHR